MTDTLKVLADTVDRLTAERDEARADLEHEHRARADIVDAYAGLQAQAAAMREALSAMVDQGLTDELDDADPWGALMASARQALATDVGADVLAVVEAAREWKASIHTGEGPSRQKLCEALDRLNRSRSDD